MSITIKSNPDGVSGAIQVNGVNTLAFGNGAQFSFRNKIINGAFAINQRAYVSGTATTAGQYTLDRWKVSGTGGITFSTVDNKTTVTIPAGQTLQQVIEGLNLATGTYVLSWEGTAQGRIGGGSYGASGTVTASITGGTNTTIEFNTGTVANVQLESGSISTPFEHCPYGTELTLCQRYYETISGNGILATGQAWSSSTAYVAILLKVEKRVAPTVTLPVRGVTVGTAAFLNAVGSRINAGTFTLSSTSTSCFFIGLSGASGLVTGDAAQYYVDGADIKVSAEI